MPPKKKDAPNKKNVDKAKAKVVEDKTFGLKNKKGKKQQTYIKTVAHQVEGNKKKAAEAAPKLTKRELEKQKLEELNDLFKPVQQAQKVAAGVDPKSVLCSFFKNGTCGKGNKCKFSHDLSIERKSEKRSMYDDGRDENKDGMESWDQQTLEDVVNTKHGASNAIKTDIVCKYFLEAIEKNVYGWFWTCPNGEKCIYRHALPPGFVLKNDKKNEEDEADKISLEEHIENERNQLTGDLTPVTLDTFLAWKKRKIEEKKAKYNKEMNKKKEDFKTGRLLSKISGKEVFLFKPEMADADDDEADDDLSMYRRDALMEEIEEDQAPCAEINLEEFSMEAAAASAAHIDNTKISKAASLSVKERAQLGGLAPTIENNNMPVTNTRTTDVNGLNQACASTTDTSQGDVILDGVPVDESLFEDLDLDDLDMEE